MKKHYTVGVLIGNANSPHTMKFMEGIYQCAASMNVNVVYLLGIHSSFYYRSYFGEDTRDDFDYQFNVVYDYADLTDADALIIAYGTLHIFSGKPEKDRLFEKVPGTSLHSHGGPGRRRKGCFSNYRQLSWNVCLSRASGERPWVPADRLSVGPKREYRCRGTVKSSP